MNVLKKFLFIILIIIVWIICMAIISFIFGDDISVTTLFAFLSAWTVISVIVRHYRRKREVKKYENEA